MIPALGEEKATKLHQDMLEQKLLMAHDHQIASIDLYCYPERDHPYFQQLPSKYAVELHNQTGVDLGERMADAMQRSINKHSNAVLIGTDSPPLDSTYITKAFQALKDGADAVIGPAEDGGYILIGLSRFNNVIFNNIVWGEKDVFKRTIARFSQLGFEWFELETLWDVDTPDDLIRYNKYLSLISDKTN